MRNGRTDRSRSAQSAHRPSRFRPDSHKKGWQVYCSCAAVVWFLEKQNDVLVCEIRKADDDSSYEFEIAGAAAEPTTYRFASPADLIANYLKEHSRLMSEGWRPRGHSQAPE